MKELSRSLGQFQISEEELKGQQAIISQLQKSKEELTEEIRTLKCELQSARGQSDTTSQQLADCRHQLDKKIRESVEYVRVSNDEQQKLHEKIKDLEERIELLETSLHLAKEDASCSTEKLRQEQERVSRMDEEFKQKLELKESIIAGFAKEKRDYIAECKSVSENTRNEVLKSSNAIKAEMIVRHETERKKLERRCLVTEKRLQGVIDDLKKTKEESELYQNQISELQYKLLSSERQVEQNKKLEDEVKSKQHQVSILSELKERKMEIVQLRELLEISRCEINHLAEEVCRDRQEVNEKLLKFGSQCEGNYTDPERTMDHPSKKVRTLLTDEKKISIDQKISKSSYPHLPFPETKLKDVSNDMHISGKGEDPIPGQQNSMPATVNQDNRNRQRLNKKQSVSNNLKANFQLQTSKVGSISTDQRFSTQRNRNVIAEERGKVAGITALINSSTNDSPLTVIGEPSIGDIDPDGITAVEIRPFSTLTPIDEHEAGVSTGLGYTMEDIEILDNLNGFLETVETEKSAISNEVDAQQANVLPQGIDLDTESQTVRSTRANCNSDNQFLPGITSHIANTKTAPTPKGSSNVEGDLCIDSQSGKEYKSSTETTAGRATSKKPLKSVLKRGTSLTGARTHGNQGTIHHPLDAAMIPEAKGSLSREVKRVTGNLNVKRGAADTPYNRVVSGHFSKPAPLNPSPPTHINANSLGQMSQISEKIGCESSVSVTGLRRYSLKRYLSKSSKDMRAEKPTKAPRLSI
ncbi:hypothetical protein F5884DRAFT_213436 [Xylogone sp. PMI_703]|nr:hypothetical protein F5884DRAFT_213436 [Xylogone sp. PMI_703]